MVNSLADVAENLDCRSMNFWEDDLLGSTYDGRNNRRPNHNGIDMQTGGQRSNFYTPISGRLTYHDQRDANGRLDGCGHYARITASDGRRVTICHLDPTHDVDAGDVAAGALIGRDGETGSSTGPHLHLILRDADRNPMDPLGLWGGEDAMTEQGFTFDFDGDPETCQEPQ